MRKMDFVGEAGTSRSGRLELPQGPARGWALFAHCFACGKDNLAAVRIARGLAARGIGTLRFDFGGVGDSAGDVGFAGEIADIVAAARAMAAADMAPTLLVGHSLGGAAALAAAAELPGITAVATIAAPFSVDRALQHLDAETLATIERDGSAQLRLGPNPIRVGRRFVEEVRRYEAGTAIEHLGRPLLILHSPRDQVVPIDEATRIFVAARHPKSFVSLDPADHLLTGDGEAGYVSGVIAAWAAPYLPPVAAPVPELDAVAEETGAGKFQVAVHAGGATFLADEPESVGGLGSGPSPFALLASALAACTTMTLRLYAEGKGWPVRRIRTAAGHQRDASASPPDLFARRIAIDGDLDDEQRARLVEIADRCPVHRTLERGARVVTSAGEPPAEAEPAEAHAQAMQRLADSDR